MIRWDAEGFEVAFTTRLGGVSEGPYASLNLGRKSGDDVERVDENRRIACEGIGAELERLALNFQVHSNRVLQAAPGMRNERADGLWTNQPGLPVLAMSADCLPIVVARASADDPEQSRPYFRRLRELAAEHGLRELSMGTSQDYRIAAEEGATYVRVGSTLFGDRRPA